MWTTDGHEHAASDEEFGDIQVGPAWTLIYTSDDHPQQQLLATFGVILNRAGRYSGECSFIREERTPAHTWDDEWIFVAESDESGLFYSDHDSYKQALKDVTSELERWSRWSFSDWDVPGDF